MIDQCVNWGVVAAWVQAIGSVMAIWAAGRVVDLTARKSRLERLEGVAGILSYSANIVAEAEGVVENSLLELHNVDVFSSKRLDDCYAMLSSILGHLVQIGSSRIPGLVSEAMEAVRNSRDSLLAANTAIYAGVPASAMSVTLKRESTRLAKIKITVDGFVEEQQRRVNRWWLG